MKLIDADKLRAEFKEDYEKPLHHFTGIWAAIDAADDESKHGRWIPWKTNACGNSYGKIIVYRCSECGNTETELSPYCRKCGMEAENGKS